MCAKHYALKIALGEHNSKEQNNARVQSQPKLLLLTVFNAKVSLQVRCPQRSWRNVMLAVFGNKIIITCVSDEMRLNPFELLIVCHTVLKMGTIASMLRNMKFKAMCIHS